MRRLWLGLQTLLCLLTACAEDVDPTVLRFYVYSDAPLARVRAYVLDSTESEGADAGYKDLYPGDAGVQGDNLLFQVAVERTAESLGKDRAVLRFEGFTSAAPDSPVVLRQTVSADFTSRETRAVRIWLSQACMRETPLSCEPGFSCDGYSGICEPTPNVRTETFDVASQMGSWTPGTAYRACGERIEGRSDGMCPDYCSPAQDEDCKPRAAGSLCTRHDQCAYPMCSDSACARTVVSPPPSAAIGDSIDFMVGYMRRVVGVGPGGIAAIGINAERAGETYRLFVATDEAQKPGVVVAQAEVTVTRAPTRREDGSWSGTEYVFPTPPRLTGQAFWIGVQISDTRRVQVARLDGMVIERTVIAPVPADGERFADDATSELLEPLASPYLYVVLYP